MSRVGRHLFQALLGPRGTRHPRPGQASVEQPGEVHHAIEEFSFFKGVIHIAGWVHAPEAAIRSLAIEMPDGGLYPLRNIGLASPDVAARLGPSAGRARFDDIVPIPHPIAVAPQAKLRVWLGGRRGISISDLGGIGTDPAHSLVPRFQHLIVSQNAGHLLEVGSRARSGIVRRGMTPPGWDYTGLDIVEGPNVDVVGDAHSLATVFAGRRFDAVMSFSVLEHLFMPWRFVIELNRVLNIGAIGLFTTHQTWPLHEQPWDFWRFSDRAWASLLNGPTGFEIIDAQMGEPCYVVAAKCHPAVAFDDIYQGRLASSVLFRKIGETALQWPVSLDQVISTSYPRT